MILILLFFFFFFKQKTAYEMRISDWSSDVCSSDLGVPKNFIQDTVVCAEILGHEVDVHKYAVQITVADVRDGACSSSTLQEAASWGKVSTAMEQMVFAEAGSVIPLLASGAYHRGHWKTRPKRAYATMFDSAEIGRESWRGRGCQEG